MTIRDEIREFVANKLLEVDKIECEYQKDLALNGIQYTLQSLADEVYEELK